MDEPAVDLAFSRHLGGEVLRSERRRVLNLASMLTSILAVILVLLAVAPGVIHAVFRGPIPWHLPLAVFLPFILYELAVAGGVTMLARRGRGFPRVARYANALIETSFPTLLIYVLSRYIDAPVVFNSWPSLLYFLFIILSTLRLDFFISAFTGAVAAVELFVLADYRLHLTWGVANLDRTIIFHLSRSVVLVAAGLLAGLVGVTIRGYFARALAAASARDRVTNLSASKSRPRWSIGCSPSARPN